MIPIVTATDEAYLPGTVALYNSYKTNSQEGFSFHVLAYGDEALKQKLESHGMNVILNAPVAEHLPMSEKYDWFRHDIESSAMYARLIVPSLFPDSEYSIFIDADAIILRSLDGLIVDMKGHPCACMKSWATMKADVPDAGLSIQGLMASFIVFNRDNWIKKGIYQKCVDLMNTSDLHFKTVVQGVLSYVLRDDFHKYPDFHQVQGSHDSTPKHIDTAYILHFCGYNPWDELPEGLLNKEPYRKLSLDIWSVYA